MAISINGQMQAVGGWRHALSNGHWLEALVASIASIVGMVPQGLVLITSIAFAVAALKLSRSKVFVQSCLRLRVWHE
jgi:cation-transporting ATPase E